MRGIPTKTVGHPVHQPFFSFKYFFMTSNPLSYERFLEVEVRLPYCKSLLKTFDAECRNVAVAKRKLIEESTDLVGR